MSQEGAGDPQNAEAPGASTPSTLLRARRALGRVRRRFAVDTFDIFARRLTPEDEEFTGVEGYTFRWGEPEDVEGCDAYHTELDEAERKSGVARLGFEHRVILALSGDQVVFSMWVNPRNLNVPGLLKRKLQPDQWFIYKAFTSPDHRGKKLYGAGMRFVLAEMCAAGLGGQGGGPGRLVGYAHVKKKISRKGLARLNFESLGKAWSLVAPGLSHVAVSSDLAKNFPDVVPRTGILD